MNWALGVFSKQIRTIQIVSDILLVAAAWTIAYVLRFLFLSGAQTGLDQVFIDWFFPLAGLTFYFMLRNQIYDRDYLPPFSSEAMEIMRANTTALLAFIVLLYFVSDGRISRLTLVFYAALSTLLLLFGRAFIRSFVRKLRRRGFLLKRVYAVGDGGQIERYLETVRYTPGTGLDIAAAFGTSNDPGRNFEFPKFSLEELDKEIARSAPDVVVLGFADEASPFVGKFIESYYDSLFMIQVLPAERHSLLGLTFETVEGVNLLTLNQPRFSATEAAAKRLIDVLGSGIGLIALSPLFALIALLIRLTSPGPIFFGQDRVGQDGEQFKMWKFRSMRLPRPGESTTGWTIENDPRRTRIGTFIRSTSIDELPQLWNVFVGNMSLVGPRPEQPYFVEKFRKEIPAYMLRHKMKAGITGWAQVSGWRGDTSLEKRIEFDIFYIRNWNLWFDFKILVMTFVRGFVNKNAY